MTFPVSPRASMTALALAIVSPFAQADMASAPIDAIVITASRVPQAAADVLSDHVLLSADDIARSGATNVIDLLQQQRGIEVARNGGPGTNASVFLRGGDSKQTVVLVDGVRIGSSTTGIANWSALPLANIDRIEIIYGPLATMYGADAIGGVIQVFTRRGAGEPRLAAGISAGSEKHRAMDASIHGGTGRMHFAVTAAHDEEEGFSATVPGQFSYNPDNDGYAKTSASAQAGYRFDERHEAGLLFMASRMDAQYDAGAGSFDARSEQELNNVALYTRHQFTPVWQLRLQAARADDKARTFANPSATGISSVDTRQTLYSAQNDIALGRDLLQVLLERREEDVVASSTAGLTRGRTTNSGAVSYSLRRGAHIATASARLDDSSQYGSKSTGGLGYGYRITPHLRANASIGSSFRAPTFNELYFPRYGIASNRPETGRNAEAGLAYNGGAVEASTVYYRNRLTDLLVNAPRCPIEVATHPFGCAYNINEATLSGLSMGARATLGRVDLRGTVDFQNPRDDTTGKQLVRRARRHGNLSAEYAGATFSVGASLHASGKRFDDLANRTVLGGYGVLNVHASWRFAPDWSAFIRANNVTGKRYELARGYATAGSQVFAGLRYGTR
ncbi:TonB-dependent receptor [Massilia sp. PAMC28688]|uniref:TonB-dependent receptor plug domain-containing protein n=1 Tax=Massilia sp. PAMC28688 TaxID=2861283 RepID=UPI001C639714|nr:TonB-dependent receptor [Massilia sp. PAMC28688]QYF94591.1 TonB-dependent receptor [Massilia sp. PAMC28688]